MRLIPKSTKVKMQFYKGITFADIILGLMVLLLVTVVTTSNLPYKFIIAIGIVCICLPMFLSIGEEKIYMSAFYIVRHLFSKKSYTLAETQNLIPYESIEGNCIKNKDGSFTGVVEIKPIEFRLLSKNKQDYIIDGIVATVLESIGNNQQATIVRLEKPFCLNGHIQKELYRLQDVVRNRENRILSEKEYKARVDIIEDRMTLLDNLNSGSTVKYSAFYLALFDKDSKSLVNSLEYIKQLFNSASIEADILNCDGLLDFIKSFINNTPFEEGQEKKLENAVPKLLDFKAMSTRQDDKTLSLL